MNRYARKLLIRLAESLLPKSDREVILGDLEEMYARRSAQRGRRVAGRAYVWDLVRSAFQRRRAQVRDLLKAPPRTSPQQSQNMFRERHRGRDPLAGLEVFLKDVRYAIRSLSRNWGFTLGVGVILGLAIGANIAIFSLINTILLRPLPYPDAERIVSIETVFTNTGRSSPDVSGPDFIDLQDRSGVFEQTAALFGGGDFATMVGDQAIFANASFVTADFFTVFGQSASAGRLLTAENAPTAGADATTAVVAHEWAVANFGSAAAAIGSTIALYGVPLEIVGVAVPGFRYPGSADLWVPLLPSNGDRGLYDYQAVAKLRPEVDLARAESEVRAIGDDLARQHAENELKTLTLTPLKEHLTGSFEGTLWVLMSAVGVVWLIACANIANLLLARATRRSREIALRSALGASGGRVRRQLLAESCVLAGVAGLGGLVLAWMLVQGVVALSPADLPRIDDVRMDATVLLFAFGLAVMSTVLLWLVAVLHASRLDLSDALKQGGSKATAAKASTRLRSGLVVAEVAMSVILLASAGLLVQSFRALQQEDLGFTTDDVLVAYTEYAVESMEDIWDRVAFYSDVLDSLRATPGVRSAAGVAYLGMGREPRSPRDYFIEGRPEGRPGERPQAEFHAVTEGYFETLEIPLLAGRDFARSDTRETSRVAIINETLARTAFPGESPLGRQIRTTSATTPPMEIVGVVGDTRWQEPSEAAPPVIYASATQGVGNSPSILVRTSFDEGAVATTLRRILNEGNPTVPVRLETLDEMFNFTLRYPRFRTQVIGLFAALATVLAAVGIFSVLAYLVGQRTREFAVRRAMGARAADIIQHIVGQGLRLFAVGLVLGLAGALAVAQMLSGLLYEIDPWNPGAYVGTVIVLGGAALLATIVPAMRAATIAPVAALQQE